MRTSTPFTLLAVFLLCPGDASAQSATAPPDVLATVRIMGSVLANGKPLPAGTYELRLTGERPKALVGQSADAQRWVEFVAGGTVVAREIAEVLRDDDRPAEGASSRPARSGTQVATLQGGEFLRISVKRGNEQFLVHLPIVR